MNRFLRTAPTRRVLSVLLGACALIAVGSTLALAASSGGPVPPAKPLAEAIHTGLAGPQVTGISADIQFTNNLIDASELQGSDPLLSGGTGRLWLSNDHRFRLELQTSGGSQDAQIVVDHNRWWAYDPGSNTVYEGTLPADAAQKPSAEHRSPSEAIPSVAKIQQELDRVMQHLNVSGAIPGDVAGQPAYTVRVSPQQSGGLVGAAELAWDAVRGVPLRFALYARGDASPVLELDATSISYGPQPASVFSVTPPGDAKVVKVASASSASGSERKPGAHHRRGKATEVTGVAAVASHLPFSLDAPASLGGLSRQSVKLLSMSSHPAALVVYGHGLGSVVVLEQAASRSATRSNQADGQGLSLPTISVNGTSAQELDTAIGTLVRFTRAGVSYTVAGSVTKSVAEAAARGL